MVACCLLTYAALGIIAAESRTDINALSYLWAEEEMPQYVVMVQGLGFLGRCWYSTSET